MESFIAAQNPPTPTPATPPQRTIISKIIATPVSVVPTSQPAQAMRVGFPWGMPLRFVPEGCAPIVAPIPTSSPIMYVPPPMVHVMPHVNETAYHYEPSEGPDVMRKWMR